MKPKRTWFGGCRLDMSMSNDFWLARWTWVHHIQNENLLLLLWVYCNRSDWLTCLLSTYRNQSRNVCLSLSTVLPFCIYASSFHDESQRCTWHWYMLTSMYIIGVYIVDEFVSLKSQWQIWIPFRIHDRKIRIQNIKQNWQAISGSVLNLLINARYKSLYRRLTKSFTNRNRTFPANTIINTTNSNSVSSTFRAK